MTIGKLSSHLQAKQSLDASLFREKLIECKYDEGRERFARMRENFIIGGRSKSAG